MYFDDSWKEEVSNSVKLFRAMAFHNSHSNGIVDQTITLAEVSLVVKVMGQCLAHTSGFPMCLNEYH